MVGMLCFRLFWRRLSPRVSRVVQDEHSTTENAVMGGAARLLAAGVMMPFTVVKTRVESGLFHYQGVGHALLSIGREQGIRG